MGRYLPHTTPINMLSLSLLGDMEIEVDTETAYQDSNVSVDIRVRS